MWNEWQPLCRKLGTVLLIECYSAIFVKTISSEWTFFYKGLQEFKTSSFCVQVSVTKIALTDYSHCAPMNLSSNLLYKMPARHYIKKHCSHKVKFTGPCSRTISRTPWKNPRYLGFGKVWSWINLTLIVSWGVTVNIASLMPAPSNTAHKTAKPIVTMCMTKNT